MKPGGEGGGLHQDVYYLPQKPYNVIGTLRDQITYPGPPTHKQAHITNLPSLSLSL